MKVIENIEKAVSVASVAVMSVLVFVNVIARFVFRNSLAFSDEISSYLFILMSFMGSAISARRKAHLGLSIVTDRLSFEGRKRLGMVMYGISASALYIFTPLFAPVALHLGINPIHLGVIMIFNLAIGLFTPPVGVNLYVACGIGDVKIEEISKGVIPLVLAEIGMLLIITYIPAISLMFVPH